MRFVFFLTLLFSSLPAASSSLEWLPLPANLSWHSDHPTPAAATLVGRSMAIVVVDWERRDEANLGQITYWNQAWLWTDGGRSVDFRQSFLCIGCNGQLPGKKQDESARFLKAQDNNGGLVKALTGDGSAALLLVNANGRVVTLQRFSGEANAYVKELDALMPKVGALVPEPSQLPIGCQPALNLLKMGDLKGAQALCSKKLGADGVALLKVINEQAGVMAAGEAARLSDTTLAAGDRMIARGRLNDLIASFPAVAKQEAVMEAMKAIKGDKALAQEDAAWDALMAYFTAAGKAQPKKLAEVQKQQLNAITEKFADTYAAELAAKIKKAARVE